VRRATLLVALALAGGCSSTEPPPAPAPAAREAPFDLRAARVLDLTYAFGPQTIYWPTATPFARKDTAHGTTEGGFYAAGDYAASEHGGTHLDAPVHFFEKGVGADGISPSRLVGPAWVLDAREACAKDPDHLVATRDVSGEIPENAIVLVLTGWGRYWPDKKSYLGDDRPGKTDALSFPGLDPELARELVKRKAKAVGIDTASIDRGKSTKFEAHRVLAEAGVPIFENVANLDGVPSGTWIVAAPMKIENGTGGPLRMIALTPRPVARTCTVTESAAKHVLDWAPVESDIEQHGPTPGKVELKVAVAATFAYGPRAAELEAALSRALFRAQFDDAAWKAPPWPAR
jgi:kynurenine formamidase